MVATAIFLGTYVVLALGRMPGLRVDRTGAAIIGASLMVATNVLSLDEAYQAIHLDTIVLLFGMMIVVANLRHLRILRPGGGVDPGARPSSDHAPGRDRRHRGRAVGVLRERYGLPGDGAAGGRSRRARCAAT